jgi:hypothetical protein
MPAAITVCPACHHRGRPDIVHTCHAWTTNTTPSADTQAHCDHPGNNGIRIVITSRITTPDAGAVTPVVATSSPVTPG